MSIKKSQVILKCFIELKSTVWFSLLYAGLRGRNHVLWHLELFSARLPVKVFKTLMTSSPIFSINFTNRKNPAKPNYHMSIKKSQAILKYFIDLKCKKSFKMVQAGPRKGNHVLWHLKLFSDRLPLKVFKTLNDRQSGIFNKFHKSKTSSHK